jgi:2-dehydro-3-deoxyphosphogluconate aldolase/(4S)-4-hydroxy-2-oxoglutarate aldolase
VPERTALPEQVRESRLIAVLRAKGPDRLVEVARTLIKCGVCCIEMTLSTPGALDAVRELAASEHSGVCIGVGTILTAADVEASIDAGAAYLLAPIYDPASLRVAQGHAVPFVPGAATPTEIVSAWDAGASAVKVFPAQLLGGPAFIASVLEPLPDMALIPTGGVSLPQLVDYFSVGAVAVGVGSSLIGDTLSSGSLNDLKKRAQQYLAGTAKERVSR